MRHTFAGLMGPEITTDLTTFTVKGGGVEFRADPYRAYDEALRAWLEEHDEGSLPAFRAPPEPSWEPVKQFTILTRPIEESSKHFKMTILTCLDDVWLTSTVMRKLPHHLSAWQRKPHVFEESVGELTIMHLRFSKDVQSAYAVWTDQRKEAGL